MATLKQWNGTEWIDIVSSSGGIGGDGALTVKAYTVMDDTISSVEKTKIYNTSTNQELTIKDLNAAPLWAISDAYENYTSYVSIDYWRRPGDAVDDPSLGLGIGCAINNISILGQNYYSR